MEDAARLAYHQHGKSRVRVGRAWRCPASGVHHFVEWSVSTMLESDMEHAFRSDSNASMTSTDTQKNAVYFVAKQLREPCSPEEFGLALARHFVRSYCPTVWKAKVQVEAKSWQRVEAGGVPHEHGFTLADPETRTAYVTVDAGGAEQVTAGLRNLTVLKTTQSGYAGFLHDELTTLPDTSDRILATALTASWKYSSPPASYDEAFKAARGALLERFFGPPHSGVSSPSVQRTIFQAACELLARVHEAESVFVNAPNVHFLPCAPPGASFDNDVYIATSEPHGNIEAEVTRAQAQPHCRL